MKTILMALAATTFVGSAAIAQNYPRPYPGRMAPAPYGLTSDEARDYARDQLDRRHEIERERLRMNQKAERRALGLDD